MLLLCTVRTRHAADVDGSLRSAGLNPRAYVIFYRSALRPSARQRVRDDRYVQALDGHGVRVAVVVDIQCFYVLGVRISVVAVVHASRKHAVWGYLLQRAALCGYQEPANEVPRC